MFNLFILLSIAICLAICLTTIVVVVQALFHIIICTILNVDDAFIALKNIHHRMTTTQRVLFLPFIVVVFLPTYAIILVHVLKDKILSKTVVKSEGEWEHLQD